MTKERGQKTIQKLITPEDVLFSIAINDDLRSSRILIENGVSKSKLKRHIQQYRNVSSIDSPSTNDQKDALVKYTQNVTNAWVEGKLDPVIGREDEIKRTIQVICRRTKNNPVLIGELRRGENSHCRGSCSANCEWRCSRRFEK